MSFDGVDGASGGHRESSAGNDEELADMRAVEVYHEALRPHLAKLQSLGIRRVTFLAPHVKQGKSLLRAMYVNTSVPKHSSVRSQNNSNEPSPVLSSVAASTGTLPPSIELPTTPCGELGSSGAAAAASSAAKLESPSVVLLPGGMPRKFFRTRAASLSKAVDVGTGVSVLRGLDTLLPSIHTFRAASSFNEDSIVRHIEPTHAGHLELRRMSNFRIRLVPTPNPAVHVYEAVPKTTEASPQSPLKAGKPLTAKEKGEQRKRFFVRALVRQTDRIQSIGDLYDQFPGPEVRGNIFIFL